MTDQTDGILSLMQKDRLDNAWGPKTRQRMAEAEAKEKKDEAEKAGKREFDRSVLSQPGAGPSRDQYDYGALVTDGMSLAEDETGGVNLPNRYVKPGNMAVSGYDVATGENVLNDNLSTEGKAWAQDGLFGIRQSFTHTIDGAPIDVTGQLAKVAFAYAADGRSYEDYVNAVPGTYHGDAAHKAWVAAQRAQLRINYENLVSTQALLEMKRIEEMGENVRVGPAYDGEDTIEVEELPGNADWLAYSKYTYELLEGRPFVGTPAELSNWAVEEMGYFNNSSVYMARSLAALHDASPEEAAAFLSLLAMYERVEPNIDTALRAVGAMAGDLPAWALGGVGARVGMQAAKKAAIRNVAQWSLAGMVGGAIEGAVWGGLQESARQAALVMSGEQESADVGEVAGEVGKGAAVVSAAGAAIPPAVHYGTRAAQAGGQMLRRWVNESEFASATR